MIRQAPTKTTMWVRRAHGQAGDSGGPAVQDHSIDFGRAPGIGHMPHTGVSGSPSRLRNHRPQD
jgi:hypothetical protein